MAEALKRLTGWCLPNWAVPLLLLGLCILSYGLLLPWLGVYWDDWAFSWISQHLGAAGLSRYFATNRPFWGLIYQWTTAWIGPEPWQWQLFGLAARWLCAVSLWWLLRLLWPRQPQAAAWVSILFVVYPGFDQQPIAITYGHFFIVLTAFFLSLSLMLLALRRPRRFALFTALALLASAVNLLAMEYFYLLDLLRPLLIGLVLAQTITPRRERLRLTLVSWLPYLVLFITTTLWRALFFGYQTHNYQPLLLEQLKTQPLAALLSLAGTVLHDLWAVSFGAWATVLRLPDPQVLGGRTTQLYAGVVALTALLVFLALMRLRTPPPTDAPQRSWALPTIGLGAAALLVAGWPFWLTQLPIGLIYPNNRFTLPFMLGASLLMAGLLRLLPLRRWMHLALLGIFVALAVGVHFQSANAYRRDWDVEKTLFWQMVWRMPQIEPGTALLTNDLPTHYSSDNSLTAALNWTYAPANRTQQMSYMLYYTTVRLNGTLQGLQPQVPIDQDYLAAAFHGNTSQVIALYFEPPGCLRVLDPQLDAENQMISTLMRRAALLSRQDLIQSPESGQAAQPPAAVFGEEPAHGWCYYYEKADLARQQQDWETVVALGEQAFALGDYPNDPAERFPFIEGYAHTGNWPRALELSQESQDITPLMQPVLCRLWQRIETSTPASAEKEAALQAATAGLGCK